MKSKLVNIVWGIVLIILSGILVAEALGTISFGSVTRRDWAMVFAVASAAFFLTYFLDGVKHWGWLFPALICASMSWSGFHPGHPSDFINPDWPLLAAIAIPFYVGFALDRKRWGLLIPAYILTMAAFLTASNEMASGLSRITSANRMVLSALVDGAGPLFLVALPFFVLYFWSKKNWWALMIAGVLTSFGMVTVLSILIPNGQNAMTGVYNAILLLGFAATMGALWLRRSTQPTGWAKYPAAGFLALAVAAFILGVGWEDLSQEIKAIVFAVGSAAFFLAYFLHGVRKWGWLFPAFACAAIAVTIWMETIAMGESITGVPIFAGMALPFFVGFAVDRRHWGLLLPATILTAFTIFLLIEDAIPEEWTGVIFMSLFALPFFVTYFWSKHNWWALIPAGCFTSIGLVVLVENLIPHQEYPSLPNTISLDVTIWVLFLGLAATFGAVWLRHETEPTGWAKYPAVGLLAVAVLAFILGERFQEFWPATVTLVIGVMFLLVALNKRKLGADQPGFACKA